MVQIFFITLSVPCKRNNNVIFGVLFDSSTYADYGNKIYIILCYDMLCYVNLRLNGRRKRNGNKRVNLKALFWHTFVSDVRRSSVNCKQKLSMSLRLAFTVKLSHFTFYAVTPNALI